MRLTELEPQWLRCETRKAPDPQAWEDGVLRAAGAIYHVYPHVQSIADAQGICFLCPVCFKNNGGAVGTHQVLCWSRTAGVPDDATPGPGRWRLVGTSYDDLSLMEEPGQSRSVLLTGDGCGWHGYVTSGEVTDA